MPATPRLFFYFKMICPMKSAERIGIGQHDQRNMCVAFLTTNYAQWQKEYFFFISSEFMSGSRETWMAGDEVDYRLHPSLGDTKFEAAQHINEMCHEHGFKKGVPFWLAAREEFTFEHDSSPRDVLRGLFC